MILIKDKNNDTYVFCNVEFVLHENENGNGYCTIRDMIEHKLLYKCFTDNIRQLTVDGVKLIMKECSSDYKCTFCYSDGFTSICKIDIDKKNV